MQRIQILTPVNPVPFSGPNVVGCSVEKLILYYKIIGYVSEAGAKYATFFFVDMIELSDSILTMDAQAKKIALLNEFVAKCDAFKTSRGKKYILPTGDGMAIGFIESHPNIAVKLAIELHRLLNTYNQGRPIQNMIRVRIGINHGQVVSVKDLNGRSNFWGNGIVMARRIMDLGSDSHILATDITGEELRDYSEEYRSIVHALDYYTLKHGKRVLVHSIYGEGFGNPEPPRKGEEVNEIRYLTMSIMAKVDGVDRVSRKLVYEIQNLTDSVITNGPGQRFGKSMVTKIDGKIKCCDDKGELTYDKESNKDGVLITRPILRKPVAIGARTTYWYDITTTPGRILSYSLPFQLNHFEFVLDYPDDGTMEPKFSEYSFNQEWLQDLNPTLTEKTDGRKIIKLSRWTPSLKVVKVRW